jgi:Leucine rich repeat variant
MMMGLGDKKLIFGSLFVATGLAVFSTALLYRYSLQDNLFGPMLAPVHVVLRTACFFLLVWSLAALTLTKTRWYVKVGLVFVVAQEVFYLLSTFQLEFAGIKRERHQNQVTEEASRISNGLYAGNISDFRSQVGSEALTRALVSFVDSKRINAGQLHEIVAAYVADDYLMARVSKHNLTPPADLRMIFEFYQNPDTHKPVQFRQDWYETLANVARNPHTPPDVLVRAMSSYLATIVVSNSSCPEDARSNWLRKTSLGSSQERLNVAGNVYAPPDLLLTLVRDPELRVRVALAANPRSPRRLLEKLSTDPDMWVRRTVAENSSTLAMLERLAVDHAPQVRVAVACNGNTPESWLARMAVEDADSSVRQVAESCLQRRAVRTPGK